MKIRPVGAQLFHVYGHTDGHDKANTVVVFNNFAKAPKSDCSLRESHGTRRYTAWTKCCA